VVSRGGREHHDGRRGRAGHLVHPVEIERKKNTAGMGSKLNVPRSRLCGVDAINGGNVGGCPEQSAVQLFGPDVKPPGDVVQTVNLLNSTADSIASNTFVAFAHSEITITPQSATNGIALFASGTLST
jgi:hypothetical protein